LSKNAGVTPGIKCGGAQCRKEFVKRAMNPDVIHMHKLQHKNEKMKKGEKRDLVGLNSSSHMSYTREKEKGETKELACSNSLKL